MATMRAHFVEHQVSSSGPLPVRRQHRMACQWPQLRLRLWSMCVRAVVVVVVCLCDGIADVQLMAQTLDDNIGQPPFSVQQQQHTERWATLQGRCH